MKIRIIQDRETRVVGLVQVGDVHDIDDATALQFIAQGIAIEVPVEVPVETPRGSKPAKEV